MRVSRLNITNIRSYINTTFDFSNGLNIIIGPNNSGKSTILRSLLTLQHGPDPFSMTDKRLGQVPSKILVHFDDTKTSHPNFQKEFTHFSYELNIPPVYAYHEHPGSRFVSRPEPEEPNNFIYPYLSKRKVASFNEQINSKVTSSITGTFQNLYAKIDQVSNPNFQPAYDEYVKACDEILGFRISCVASPNGKKAAYIIKNHDHIPLDAMGEGIANLLGLIVDLCVSENKIFLIEEPENDIHPKALKSLLNLIAEKSKNNQFFITTHSNIVTKHLGAQPGSRVISISMDFEDKIPTSSFEYIDTPEKRRQILEDLGYELYDLDIWSAWLLLEESSAELIIRDFLIPMFTPELQGKLRTYSARTISEVESKFTDFNNLFVFLHLEPSYKNKSWVILDHGEREIEIIKKMKETYSASGWKTNKFINLSKHNFEEYYPSEFSDEVKNVLALTDKKEKRSRKKSLLDKVIAWSNEDKERAKNEFEKSAAEIIEILKEISRNLK